MGQQGGVQVDITRYAKATVVPSCGHVASQLSEAPRKQRRAPTSLFALLSKTTAAQPHQEPPRPPSKKPRNALSAIFRQRRHAADELITADGALQQGNLAPAGQSKQLSGRLKPSADRQQQHRQARQPTCSMGTQPPAAPPAGVLCQTTEHDTAQIGAREHAAVLQQSAPNDNSKKDSIEARLQECPLCGAQLPAEQLQQHVDEELQDLEDLESRHQPLRQPLQQQALQTHPQLQQEQQTQSSHPSQQHPAGAWQLLPTQHLMQPVADPQQMPLKPLQLPRLSTPKLHTRSRQSQHFALQQQQQQVYHQQQQQAYHPGQPGSSAGCGQHGSFQFAWEHPRMQQQQLQQPPQQWQWYSAPTQQRAPSQEQKMCQPPVPHQPVASALYQQQQQPSASKPLQLPKLKRSQKQDKQQRQRSRKRSRGGDRTAGSSLFSSVTTLNMAPARTVCDEPKSAVLDTFDHWGDTTINWLDDSMIGLEGAPQSAGECWEGIGRCAAGPRTLR